MASSDPVDLRHQFKQLPVARVAAAGLGRHMEQCQSTYGVQAGSTSHTQGRSGPCLALSMWCPNKQRESDPVQLRRRGHER
jgi:hypothetical protein